MNVRRTHRPSVRPALSPGHVGASPIAQPPGVHDAASLHGHYTQRPSGHLVLDHVVKRTLARHERVEADQRPVWERFLDLVDADKNDSRMAGRTAALANLVGIFTFDDIEDYVSTADLVAVLGEAATARAMHRASVRLETDAGLPWTTAAVRSLQGGSLGQRLAADPSTAQSFEEVAFVCAATGQALVLADVDESRAAAPITSVGQLADLVENGTVVDWRHHLGTLAANPWAPYAQNLINLARQLHQPPVLAGIEATVASCRKWTKDRERDQVGREIKRLVAVSGLSQREFADLVGTSASRLSTYVAGTVTPSAALLLRIQRASRTHRKQSNVQALRPGA